MAGSHTDAADDLGGTRVVNRLTTPPGARDVTRALARWGSFLVQRLFLSQHMLIMLGEAVRFIAHGLAQSQAEVLA